LFVLKDYQKKAVYKLNEHISDALSIGGSKQIIVFEAPTGSGKTIMAADLINQLSEYENYELSFIWLAPNKLEQQSKSKLENYLSLNSNIKISEWDQLQNNRIAENEIYMAGWQQLLSANKNRARIKNESNFYLDKVIENTKKHSKIITIIDESHRNIGTEKASEVLNIIDPDIILNISATQSSSLRGQSHFEHKIQIAEVKKEEMIKNLLVINDNNINIQESGNIISEYSEIDEENILEKGLLKLKELQILYKDEKSNVKPLLLVQLPRKLNAEDEQPFLEKLEAYLLQNDISYDNGRLGLYLDKNKVNLDFENQPFSTVSVLFFKEAIATGWDCPRAQILVSFRDIKSVTFSLQTIGRIMRVPEPDKGWYEAEALNNAYIYTNQENFKAHAELMKGNFLFFEISKRKDIYENLKLTSFFRPRNNPKYRLTKEFSNVFLEVARENNLINDLDLVPKKIFRKRIENESISNIDSIKEIKGSTEVEIKHLNDLNFEYDKKIKTDLVSPFNPQEANFRQIKNAVRTFFEEENSLPKLIHITEDEEIRWLKIFLSKKNYPKFKNMIEISKDKYQKIYVRSSLPIEKVNNWEIPEKIGYQKKVKKVTFSKCIMEPYFTSTDWESENNFEEFVDTLESVNWWYKNGESDRTHFAVKYVENGKEKLFYVDYIIKFKKSKKIGLFDTKQGEKKVSESFDKNDGLQKYVKNLDNVFGGIITNTKDDYSGSWKCLLSNKMESNPNNDEWVLFNDLL
tara:strand:- start:2032 stop:4272 length:2241 start_codon:yes stop_codon:yes gene_type:complete